jgi:hypothetical protein
MSLGCSDGSSLTTARAFVFMYSAMPPSAFRPGNEAFAQCESLPRRHSVHSPHVTSGCMMTVSPTATFETADPTAWTQPEFS